MKSTSFATHLIYWKPFETASRIFTATRTRTLWVSKLISKCHLLHVKFLLVVDEQPVQHLEHLYLTESAKVDGLKLCPKLSREHVWLKNEGISGSTGTYTASIILQEMIAWFSYRWWVRQLPQHCNSQMRKEPGRHKNSFRWLTHSSIV